MRMVKLLAVHRQGPTSWRENSGGLGGTDRLHCQRTLRRCAVFFPSRKIHSHDGSMGLAGMFTHIDPIKINQMQVNIPVPWILWDWGDWMMQEHTLISTGCLSC